MQESAEWHKRLSFGSGALSNSSSPLTLGVGPPQHSLQAALPCGTCFKLVFFVAGARPAMTGGPWRPRPDEFSILKTAKSFSGHSSHPALKIWMAYQLYIDSFGAYVQNVFGGCSFMLFFLAYTNIFSYKSSFAGKSIWGSCARARGSQEGSTWNIYRVETIAPTGDTVGHTRDKSGQRGLLPQKWTKNSWKGKGDKGKNEPTLERQRHLFFRHPWDSTAWS